MTEALKTIGWVALSYLLIIVAACAVVLLGSCDADAATLYERWSGVVRQARVERPEKLPTYAGLVAEARASDGVAGLRRWNDRVNGMLVQDASQDAWRTPLETLRDGRGSCVDHVLLKYAALRDAGWPESSLRVKVSQHHAVLAVLVAGDWRVLGSGQRGLPLLEDHERVMPTVATLAMEGVP